MHVTYHRKRRWLRALSALLSLLLLAACGPKKANATPTMDAKAIYTAAYYTMSAEQATQLALTPPTSTPLPPTEIATLPPTLPIPTFVFASPTAGGGGGAGSCDSSAFVADVTIPDNTTVDPGKKFTKTWTLLNNGTCTWSTGYQLVFSSGDQMGGASAPVTLAVPSGSTTNISVNLTAPTTNGTYKGIWRMQNAAGQQFGDTPWVIIKVGAGATATAGPSPTAAAACTATCTISGNLGIGGSHLSLSVSPAPKTAPVIDSAGNYSFTVPSGWSGTITPKKGTWVWSPASHTFTNVTTNQTYNFNAPAEGPTPTP